MTDKELIELGKDRALKLQKAYIFGGIGFIIVGIIAIILGVTSKSNDYYQYIGGGVLILVGGALFVMFFITKNNMLNDDKMLALGKREVERQKVERERNLQPEIEFDKEFINEKNKVKVWIKTSTKEMQFAYPEKKKALNGWRNCVKTKIMRIDSLTDLDLLHDVDEVERISGGTLHGDSYSSTNYTKKTDEYHYYAISMKFNDLDLPYLQLYFGSDGNQATTVYETINILWNREDTE